MRNLLVITSVLFTLTTHAQVINVSTDEINQQNRKELNKSKAARRAQRKARARNGWDKFGHYWGRLFLLPRGTIPRPEALTDVEEAQLRLIKCIDNLVTQNRGGTKTASIAQQLLMSAMNGDVLSTDTEDEGTLNKVYINCHNLSSSLDSYSDRDVGKADKQTTYQTLPSVTAAEKKVKELLIGLAYPKIIQCDVGDFSAAAAYGIGAGAGVNQVKCLYSNGKVKKGVGFSIRGVGGLGAAVRAGTHKMDTAGVAGPFIFQGYGDANTYAYIVPALGMINGDTGRVMDGPAAGVGIFNDVLEFGIDVRLWNGKRRWKVLLDKLK